MKKLKNMIPYLLVIAVAYYLLPLGVKNTGYATVVLLLAIPLICLLSSLFYGAKYSLSFWFILFAAILFIPSLFIFCNSTAWVYVVGYGIVATVGSLIGMVIYKSTKKD